MVIIVHFVVRILTDDVVADDFVVFLHEFLFELFAHFDLLEVGNVFAQIATSLVRLRSTDRLAVVVLRTFGQIDRQLVESLLKFALFCYVVVHASVHFFLV